MTIPSPRTQAVGSRVDHNERGFALVLVIVVVLLASFLASQLIMQVRTELTVSHNIKTRVAGHFLAEAGLTLGLFRLLDRPLETPALGAEEDWLDFSEGYPYEVLLPKGRVNYYVASEGGKIDLTKIGESPASQALLRLFLEYQLGEDKVEEIDTVIASLLDWQDNDDAYHEINGAQGAESEFYGALDDPYIARNGKITDPADFFLIKGTRSMLGKFYSQEIFTVHSTDGKINFNSLTPAMLDFLTGDDKERAAAYYDAKLEFKGHLSAAMASEILGDRFEKFQAYLSYATNNNPYYFVVGIGYAGVEQDLVPETGVVPKTPGIIDSMIIKKEGGGFTCLAWQERST